MPGRKPTTSRCFQTLETAMPDQDFDILSIDFRALTPHQKEAYLYLAIRRAEAARREVLRDALSQLGSGLRAVATACTGMVGGGWTAYRSWRLRRLAEAELRGLDDRLLRDLGISRSEIGSLVRNGGHDATRRPRPQPRARLGVPQLRAQIRHQYG
jgi:uncharacterized protein YjiS (DUF1127 family)